MFEIAAAWRNPVRRTGFYHVYRVFRMCTEQMFAYCLFSAMPYFQTQVVAVSVTQCILWTGPLQAAT